jgi:hypothetical protein
MSLIDVAFQRGDRRAVDAGDGLELDRRSRCQRAAEDPDPVGFPDLARCSQRLRLAGAGGRTDDLDACAGGGERAAIAACSPLSRGRSSSAAVTRAGSTRAMSSRRLSMASVISRCSRASMSGVEHRGPPR